MKLSSLPKFLMMRKYSSVLLPICALAVLCVQLQHAFLRLSLCLLCFLSGNMILPRKIMPSLFRLNVNFVGVVCSSHKFVAVQKYASCGYQTPRRSCSVMGEKLLVEYV